MKAENKTNFLSGCFSFMQGLDPCRIIQPLVPPKNQDEAVATRANDNSQNWAQLLSNFRDAGMERWSSQI